ncbi:MAG: DUF433 domain-containing protein [Sphingobacteriaceae bacterium]|nr:MAG: DUF433 domain-containing protein [Sphingobacteriaceae bacterium]
MAQPVDYKKFIEINPEIRFGKPVIKGTRICVYDVLGWLASGMSFSNILEDFPQLNEESIYACLSYAADKERKVRIA